MHNKLKAIYSKDLSSTVCPSVTFLSRQALSTIRFDTEFWNPDAYTAVKCILRDENHQIDWMNPREASREIQNRVAHRIENLPSSVTDEIEDGDSIVQIRTIDTVNSGYGLQEQSDQLVNEAFVGVLYLNDLKELTPSFRYIFGIYMCGRSEDEKAFRKICTYSPDNQVPYLLEENLEKHPSLYNVLEKLTVDEHGKHRVLSLLAQLLTAVSHASQVGVSNFNMNIAVRETSTDATVPLRLRQESKYIKTYGHVPVFTRFWTCATPEYPGNGRSHLDEQKYIINSLFNLLEESNPALRRLFTELPTCLNTSYFSEVIRECKGDYPLTCNGAVCTTLETFVNFVTIPVARGVVLVRSLVDRINDVLISTRSLSFEMRYVSLIVACKYVKNLLDISSRIPPQKLNTVFLPERTAYADQVPFIRRLNPEQPGAIVAIKSDMQFINDTLDRCKTLEFTDLSPTVIERYIEIGSDTALRLEKEQRGLVISKNMNTREGIVTTIRHIRIVIRNLQYFTTLNAVINIFNEEYGREIRNMETQIEDTLNLKSKIDEAISVHLSENNRSDFQRIFQGFTQLQGEDDLLIVDLYDTFIENVSDLVRSIAKNYKASLPDSEVSRYNQIYKEETTLASDLLILL